jgi:hypothetical protein
MTQFNLKPTHAPIKLYYETLEKFGRTKFDNEGNIRGAFEDLLKKCASPSSTWGQSRSLKRVGRGFIPGISKFQTRRGFSP